MAFSRKFLSALGIEADKVDQIIDAHTEVTDALKAERDKYRADAEKLPQVQEELTGLKAEKDKAGKDPYWWPYLSGLMWCGSPFTLGWLKTKSMALWFYRQRATFFWRFSMNKPLVLPGENKKPWQIKPP